MRYRKNDGLFLKQAGFLSYPVVVDVDVDLAAVVSAIMCFCFCCSSSMNVLCFPVLLGHRSLNAFCCQVLTLQFGFQRA